MADIPIIFSAPMVCGLLEGRKTQTRRLAWREVEWPEDYTMVVGRERTMPIKRGGETFMGLFRRSPWQKVKPGDRLWVRENFRWRSWNEDGDFWVTYEADGARSKCLTPPDGDQSQDLMEKLSARLDRAGVPHDDNGYQSTAALGITPCIHMPRWASRLMLIVTATKVERLQNISEVDAEAEGVTKVRDHCYVVKGFDYDNAGLCHSRPSIAYAKLWQHLHGDESWDSNPEVAALTFTVHKQNIDALPKVEAA